MGFGLVAIGVLALLAFAGGEGEAEVAPAPPEKPPPGGSGGGGAGPAGGGGVPPTTGGWAGGLGQFGGTGYKCKYLPASAPQWAQKLCVEAVNSGDSDLIDQAAAQLKNAGYGGAARRMQNYEKPVEPGPWDPEAEGDYG